MVSSCHSLIGNAAAMVRESFKGKKWKFESQWKFLLASKNFNIF